MFWTFSYQSNRCLFWSKPSNPHVHVMMVQRDWFFRRFHKEKKILSFIYMTEQHSMSYSRGWEGGVLEVSLTTEDIHAIL